MHEWTGTLFGLGWGRFLRRNVWLSKGPRSAMESHLQAIPTQVPETADRL